MNVKKRKSRRKIWLVSLIAAAVLIFSLGGGALLQRSRAINPLANVRTFTVIADDIEKTVTGSGNLSAEDEIDQILVLDGLMVDEVLISAGDLVMPGDRIATLDHDSLQTLIWNAQTELDRLDAQLNMLKNQNGDNFIRSTVDGRIKMIYAAEGDQVRDVMSRHGALLVLSLDGQMRLEIEPAASFAGKAGDAVTVTLADGTTEAGVILTVSPSSVQVTLSDRRAQAGDPATVTLADNTQLGSGYLKINEPLAVTATDGQIDAVRYRIGDAVSQGWRLFSLREAPQSPQILQLIAQRRQTADRLTQLIQYDRAGALTTDLAGEILSIQLEAGSSTGGIGSNGQSPALTLRTAREIKLVVSIDELDINFLSVGQPVRTDIQAFAGQFREGGIEKIAETGTISQGGAAYTVTIEIADQADLKLGMSATAVITVDRRENVLLIPLAALQELGGEQFVHVGEAASASSLGERRSIVTGISDGEFVEVLSGLAAGEKVNFVWNTGISSPFPFPGRTAGTNR